jgi:hypothetical protein
LAKGGRDEFSSDTKDLLGKRAGYICSHPSCHQLTVGPSKDRKSGLTMVGVAAHITAAEKGGPRYDPDISSEERASESNGIWMCQTHGKAIDDTPGRHSVAELKRWKAQHEEWIFNRVQSADSLLTHGVTRVSLERIPPFQEKAVFPLGQHNVVFGSNGAGKTSLCESIAAFAGGQNFEHFRDRWGVFGKNPPRMSIEAAVAVNGVRTIVRLTEEPIGLKHIPQQHQTRLHVEVDNNIAPHWPRSLFNVVYLERQDWKRSDVKDRFRRDLRVLARQLGLTEDQIWDGLREELFCTSTFGSRIRRTGEYRAEIQTRGNGFFLPSGSLSSSEHMLALLDVMLRFVRADPRVTPWLIILDSGLFQGFDSKLERHVVTTLKALEDPSLQTVVCLHSEEQVIELTADDADQWIGSTVHGGLTVHSFL